MLIIAVDTSRLERQGLREDTEELLGGIGTEREGDRGGVRASGATRTDRKGSSGVPIGPDHDGVLPRWKRAIREGVQGPGNRGWIQRIQGNSPICCQLGGHGIHQVNIACQM